MLKQERCHIAMAGPAIGGNGFLRQRVIENSLPPLVRTALAGAALSLRFGGGYFSDASPSRPRRL